MNMYFKHWIKKRVRVHVYLDDMRPEESNACCYIIKHFY